MDSVPLQAGSSPGRKSIIDYTYTMIWNTFLSTFLLTFVAELGDKTQLAVLAQTCKFRRPREVFLGASVALTAVTGLGAASGQLLARVVPPQVIQFVAAAGFVLMGGLIAVETWRSRVQGAECPTDLTCDGDVDVSVSRQGLWSWKAFASTFGLLLVAEMGDKTQLAILGLAGKRPAVWSVFVGGALALTLVTALAVIGGERLCRIVPERTLRWLSAAAFLMMGLLMGVGIL